MLSHVAEGVLEAYPRGRRGAAWQERPPPCFGLLLPAAFLLLFFLSIFINFVFSLSFIILLRVLPFSFFFFFLSMEKTLTRRRDSGLHSFLHGKSDAYEYA